MSNKNQADINSANPPAGKIIKQNSTHKAVKENGVINIYIKGFDVDELHYDDELIDTLTLDQQDDLFAIFERYDEDNRCNVAEANAMFEGMSQKQIDALIAWANEEPIPAPGQQPPVITEEDDKIISLDPDVKAAREELTSINPVITYEFARRENGIAMFDVFADGKWIAKLQTPSAGISSSWQELLLSEVEKIANTNFPMGFVLPYFVDGAGYVRREQMTIHQQKKESGEHLLDEEFWKDPY